MIWLRLICLYFENNFNVVNKKELEIDLLLIFELKVLKINVIGVNEFIF